MKKAIAVIAMGAVALIVAVAILRGSSAKDPTTVSEAVTTSVAEGGSSSDLVQIVKPATSVRRTSPPAPRQGGRAKEALVALFSVKPGEMPPELPQLTLEERNRLPIIIERDLTDADGCDAEAVRREYRLFLECGGMHDEFLPAYRRKLLNRALLRGEGGK